MSAANYETCWHCGAKALYVGEEDVADTSGTGKDLVVFCGTKCLEEHEAKAVERAGLDARQEVTAAHDVLTLIGGLPVEGTLAERIGVLVSRAARSGRATLNDEVNRG